ncbi:MAG: peptidase [Firmicutes bacterium]|nr:peptidase [Bacillota bacterium]
MKIAGLTPPVAAIDEAGLLGLCQRMIGLQSYTGDEGRLARELQGTMIKLGYDRAWIDAFGNVVGEVRGTLHGPSILFDGHIDTVDVSDGPDWTVPPFGGTVREGRIYGRGASDMKCALAAMIYGAASLTACRDKMAGSVYVSGTVCEETFEGLGLSKVVEAIKPDFVVIGEASALNLKRGQRGRAEIVVTTTGKAAHSSNPEVGKNSVFLMLELVKMIRQLPVSHEEFLGDGILELTDIVSSPYPGASVVPHKCRVTFDRRLLVGETEEAVLAPLRQCVQQLKGIDPQFEADIQIATASQTCHTGEVMGGKRFFPAWVLPEEHPLVAGSLSAVRQTGMDPAVTKYSFCTNGSYSAGIAGIPTIGFGPGAEDGAHVVDESIEIAEVNAAAVGYQAIAAKFLCK